MGKLRLTAAALNAMNAGDMTNAVAAMTPGGIESQEKQGQMDFVSRQTLPINGTDEPGTRDALEKMGFKFGDDADKLFVDVQFPAGWKKVAREDLSIFFSLVDDKGRKRADIFYKTAFDDERASIHWVTRYRASTADIPQSTTYAVKDCETTIYFVGVAFSADDRQRLWTEAQAWLTERYPDWRSPFAYWD